MTRRTAVGGLRGAVPGLLVTLVPVGLLELDVITSDQSQIGFLGIPLVFLGILFGALASSSGSSCSGSLMLGALVGLVAGVAVGLPLSQAVTPLLWLVIAPLGELLGAVIAVRICAALRSVPAPAER